MQRDVIVKESLPFPYAHYSETFIGFHEELGSDITFCSCQRSAIHNHLEMCAISNEAHKRDEWHPWHCNPHGEYPRVLLKMATLFTKSLCPKRLLELVNFKDDVCHKCNRRLLHQYYGCSDGPSSYFISRFRPYFNQLCYAKGLHPSGVIILPAKCPEHLKTLDEQQRVLHVEQEIRAAFCFPPKGVNRNQESELFLTIREIFHDCSVIQHYRANWLKPLELDIFIEEHKLGIEFQGSQHSEPFDHLGGEKAFAETQRRDKRKADLCKKNGIKLVTIHEGESLTDSSVRTRIRTVLPSLQYGKPKEVEKPPFVFEVPIDGGNLQCTYHHEENKLSVEGNVGSSSVYVSGREFDVSVQVNEQHVTGVDFCVRTDVGTASLKFTLAHSTPQKVNTRPFPRLALDFFKVWSMFNPRVSIVVSK